MEVIRNSLLDDARGTKPGRVSGNFEAILGCFPHTLPAAQCASPLNTYHVTCSVQTEKYMGTAYEALYGYLVSCHTCVRYCDGSKYEERLDREALRK